MSGMNEPQTLAEAVAPHRGRAFAAVDAARQRRIFCMEWLEFSTARGDKLWVTRLGWPFIAALLPEHWYEQQRYRTLGRRLGDSTGTVYRVPLPALDLVVKFNRSGQRVLLHYDQDTAGQLLREDVYNAEFLGPFAEVSAMLELRAGYYGPPDLHICAQWPLAVFSPAQRTPAWQLDRGEDAFARHAARLDRDQQFYPEHRRVRMEADRDYLVLHHWIRGLDAAALVRQGLLPAAVAKQLVARVQSDLAAKGFRVLDLKATHIILRQRPDGGLLRNRVGELVYGLVDFELLERLPEYSRAIAAGQLTGSGKPPGFWLFDV